MFHFYTPPPPFVNGKNCRGYRNGTSVANIGLKWVENKNWSHQPYTYTRYTQGKGEIGNKLKIKMEIVKISFKYSTNKCSILCNTHK